MAEHRLMRRVEEVAERLQRVRRLCARSRFWLLLGVVGLGLLVANRVLAEPLLSPVMTIAAGGILLLLGALLALRAHANAHDAALAVERRYPDLDSRLVTALGQRPNYEVGGFSFLQHEVISEALLHAQRHDWREAVPSRTIAAARLRQMAALTLFVAAFVGAAIAGLRPADPKSTAALEDAAATDAADQYQLTVDPGDTQLERGTSLLVLARFGQKLPQDVTLVTNAADGSRQEIPLSKSLEDPLFGGRVASVATDLTYHVRFDDRRSEDYRVSVFDYPQLQQADATIEYPEYTGLAVKQIEDVRRVSVVEGSRLTLTCLLNKPVATSRLFDDAGVDLELTADVTTPNKTAVTWTPDERRTLTLELIDEDGRRNKQPPQFVIDVIPNQPPDLKVAFPARDMRVSPLQELPVEAQVWDDFGLTEFGLVYQLPDGHEQTLKLGGTSQADAKVDLSHELSFESFQAQPNELVAYYFYADDIGPTGDARRTMSNMYFAEVRHFDEIYRQDNSSSAGMPGQPQEQEQGSPGAKLLQLQREIVTATWNLVRREQGEPSSKLPEDAGVVADSQGDALEAAQQLASTLEDLLSRQYLTEAIKQMRAGEEHLREASQTPAVLPLSDARKSTQAAYSALLKLQAREFLVKKSQNSPSSSSSSQQQQKLNDQLQQLELKNNRNRYESEQQDAPPADREAMQVLNRLRELARRQGDLNEKIQELENELRTAQTEADREEIERQLKRLQEEQQQLLRDLDEASERMEKPQNRSRMAEARQQAEQTREHLRQTKESLEAGQVSKALAEGTRAQRELEDLKEQFRDETAGQFEDTMRQLRDQARELAETEQQLSEQLAGNRLQDKPSDKTGGRPQLRDETPQGPGLDEAFTQQQEKLTDLMQNAEEIVRQSEASEPLLSKKLYDAVRNTRVDQPEQSLAMTSQFLKLGLKREAAQAEQQARQGIDKLREGVEQAAQSVLGNEAEALERARKEIENLTKSIGSELAQADPKFAEKQQQKSPSGPSLIGQPQDSQQKDGSSQDGKPQDSEEKPSNPESAQQPGTQQQDAQQQEGQQPDAQPGQSTQKPSGKPKDQPGQKSPGQSDQQGQQPGEGQTAQNPTQGKEGQRENGQGKPGESQSQQSGQGQGQQQQQQAQSPGSQGRQPGQGRGRGESPQDNPLSAFLTQGGSSGRGAAGPHLGPQGPLTTSEFVQWSDRMRDVEEMLEDPELRAQVAQIRDRAREMRIEVKRHSKQPDWDLVRTSIYGPMLELQDRLAEELARLEPDSEQIVPLDRDPVPDRYAELVRRYYERLGSGR